MKTALVAVIVAAGLAAAFAQPAVLTPAQTLDRKNIGELDFSPDGSRLVFTVTEPVKASDRQRNVWMLDVASGRVRQLTFSPKSDFGAKWSPDGKSIAFLSDRDGEPQLYLLPMAGGEATRLTDRHDEISTYRWSPDGTRIAFLMEEAKPDDRQKREKDKDDGRIVDKDDRLPRVWTVDVASHAVHQVTTAHWRFSQIEWMPDGTHLAAIGTPKPEADAWNEHIVSIDAAQGAVTDIDTPTGPAGGIAVSPDGTTIAYQGPRVDGPESHDLWIVPAAGGRATNLTATTIDRPVGQLRWIDTDHVMATVQRGFATALASIGRDGRAQMIDGIGVNPSAFVRSRNGTLAYAGETTTRAPELWVKSAAGPAAQVTTFNDAWRSIPLITPERVTYKSFDGVEIEASVLRPSGAATAAPFVILVHGGPTGRWSDTFEPWGQLLAARGYAVMYANIRGSTGYGEKFVEMNRADWGGGDFKDVMAAVDWAVAHGIADPKRLGIGGWSYGGYMAAWAVTQTTRFKASVSGAPVIDMASEFGTEGGSAYDEWFYGTPYEKLDGFIKSSPITFVKNAKTPTLLLQGEADTTDPIGQSQQFYRGLKRYHVDSDLVLYPRERHGLREEKHLVDRLNRIIAWYDKYLKGAATSTTQSK